MSLELALWSIFLCNLVSLVHQVVQLKMNVIAYRDNLETYRKRIDNLERKIRRQAIQIIKHATAPTVETKE